MSIYSRPRLVLGVITVPVLAALAMAVPAAQAQARLAPAVPASSFPAGGFLSGVAALSAKKAWAVGGDDDVSKTLIARWNGATWKPARIPASARDGGLNGVAVTSARNAWAVGYARSSAAGRARTMILRWNGRAWKRVPSPSPGGGEAVLTAVAATSARNAWAVGWVLGSLRSSGLILHWNGAVWARARMFQGITVYSVAAVTPDDAWAVGTGADAKISILRWNGTRWSRVPSPAPGKSGVLDGVIATSRRNAWAVGVSYGRTGSASPLIVRWNGRTWRAVRSPSLRMRDSELTAVAATSGRYAWAAGYTGVQPDALPSRAGGFPAVIGSPAGSKTFILHWNGRAWSRVPSPSSATGSELSGVAAVSSRDAWAVGANEAGILILRWDGHAWA
jgi:hypothetical protein